MDYLWEYQPLLMAFLILGIVFALVRFYQYVKLFLSQSMKPLNGASRQCKLFQRKPVIASRKPHSNTQPITRFKIIQPDAQLIYPSG